MFYTLLFVAAISLNVIAQISLKWSTHQMDFAQAKLIVLQQLLLTPLFWIAAMLYGCSMILYTIVLSKFELSKAAPVSSISIIVLIVLFSIIFLNEAVTVYKVLGVGLSLISIYLLFK